MPEKINLLCTRPLDQFLLYKAAEKNFHIDVVPFIKTRTLKSETLKETIANKAKEKRVVVFTSSHAVESVISLIPSKPNWTIFSVGGITRETIQRHWGRNAVIGTATSARELTERILEKGNIKNVLFFCGEKRLETIPDTLRLNNIEVEEIIVYETIETPTTIDRHYDGILFFSPSAVHSFFSMNTIPTLTVLFSIGKTTSTTLQTYCSNKIITSEWPGKEQVLDTAVRYFRSFLNYATHVSFTK